MGGFIPLGHGGSGNLSHVTHPTAPGWPQHCGDVALQGWGRMGMVQGMDGVDGVSWAQRGHPLVGLRDKRWFHYGAAGDHLWREGDPITEVTG